MLAGTERQIEVGKNEMIPNIFSLSGKTSTKIFALSFNRKCSASLNPSLYTLSRSTDGLIEQSIDGEVQR
tara:strand:+ start:201 stop:410 length:210 start_codon:yes stop_codon:yes gene_type:complete